MAYLAAPPVAECKTTARQYGINSTQGGRIMPTAWRELDLTGCSTNTTRTTRKDKDSPVPGSSAAARHVPRSPPPPSHRACKTRTAQARRAPPAGRPVGPWAGFECKIRLDQLEGEKRPAGTGHSTRSDLSPNGVFAWSSVLFSQPNVLNSGRRATTTQDPGTCPEARDSPRPRDQGHEECKAKLPLLALEAIASANTRARA
jgi:hypothetical protein